MNEHCVVSFAPMNRNQLNARSADLQFGEAIDRYVRLEAAHIIGVEALAKKPLADRFRRMEFTVDFVMIVASGVKSRLRIEAAKVRVSTDMVPVRVCDEDRR